MAPGTWLTIVATILTIIGGSVAALDFRYLPRAIHVTHEANNELMYIEITSSLKNVGELMRRVEKRRIEERLESIEDTILHLEAITSREPHEEQFLNKLENRREKVLREFELILVNP